MFASRKAIAANLARRANNPGFEEDCFTATSILQVKRLRRIFAKIPAVPSEKPDRILSGL
jgi:hypothetical protein